MSFYRFYQGKNKLTQIALGRTEEEETLPGLHKVSEQLVGEVGLLFTDKKSEEVVKYFNSFNQATFARAGDVSTVTVKEKFRFLFGYFPRIFLDYFQLYEAHTMSLKIRYKIISRLLEL